MDNLQPASLPMTFDLSNGQTVTIRPIRPSDASLLVEMFQHLSERTKRMRFHAFTGNLPQERIWRQALALSDLDPKREVALVAVHADDAGEHIVGVARFVRATADAVEAEAAVVPVLDWRFDTPDAIGRDASGQGNHAAVTVGGNDRLSPSEQARAALAHALLNTNEMLYLD